MTSSVFKLWKSSLYFDFQSDLFWWIQLILIKTKISINWLLQSLTWFVFVYQKALKLAFKPDFYYKITFSILNVSINAFWWLVYKYFQSSFTDKILRRFCLKTDFPKSMWMCVNCLMSVTTRDSDPDQSTRHIRIH